MGLPGRRSEAWLIGTQTPLAWADGWTRQISRAAEGDKAG